MSRRRRKIFKMSPAEFKSVGDYYLHSNPNNYRATLQEIGGGNITSVSRKMIDRIKDSHQVKNLAHADQIKSGAQAFVDKVNSAGENRNYTLDTLMDKLDEVYREKISNIESIKILNNMKDILLNLRVKRDKAGKGGMLPAKEAEKVLKKFKEEMSKYVDAVAENYKSVTANYMPLLKEDPLYQNISKEVPEGGLDPFQKIDALSQKIKNKKEISFKDLLRFFWVKGDRLFEKGVDAILGNSFERLVSDLGEEYFANLLGDETVTSFTGEEEGTLAVIDFSMTLDDANLGFTVKHYDIPYRGSYKTQDNLEFFLEPLDEKDRNLFLYMRHNTQFHSGITKTLLNMERELIMSAMVGRIFDGAVSAAENNKMVPFDLGKSAAVDRKDVTTHIWMTKNYLFWTHEMLYYILNVLGDRKTNRKEPFSMGFALQEKIRSVGARGRRAQLQREIAAKKDQLDKGKLQYIGIGQKMERDMVSAAQELLMDLPFFTQVYFTVDFEKIKKQLRKI